MYSKINYINKLLPCNNNLVIFVSNLSQLKHIDLLPDVSFYIKNDAFIKQMKDNKHSMISNFKLSNNHLANVLIILLDPLISKSNEIGSNIFEQFPNEYFINSNNLTFIFSDYLYNKYKKIVSEIIFGFCLKSYKFLKYKSVNSKLNVEHLNLYNIKIFKELKYKINLLDSINLTKDLVSEPANELNPGSYAQKCLELKKIGLKVKILDVEKLEKIGMRTLLAVAQGSENKPIVVIFEWNLKKNIKPTILVGKGVTFDTGGISIKPSNGMEEMIFDMGGSAVVVGSLMNAALNNSTKSIVGIIGLVENMPDGKAQRPGDIVKSLSGKTIEVLNTDAEGRLVLADLITYIQKNYKPKQIIDFATLTGAIMIALGTHRAGLFSNNDNLSKQLEIAGELSEEKLWRLPLGPEYDDEINTNRADVKNIGSSKFGGSIQAAQFIQRFVNNQIPWAHIDIAGVAWSDKSNKNTFTKFHNPGATGFGIQLIDRFLKGK